MEAVRNFRQLYFCCGCSLRVGCILIALFELWYPIVVACSPLQEPEVTIVIMFLLYISSSVLLLYGTLRDSPTVLFIWIIYRLAVMILTFVGLIYKIHQINQEYEEKTRHTIFFLFSMIVYVSVNGYFWTIVYSYHGELKDKARRQTDTLPTIQKF